MKRLKKIWQKLRRQGGLGPNGISVAKPLPDPVSILVIAGNYQEYRDYLARSGLNPADYRYIYKPEDIFGYHKVKILRVGRYWKNPMDRASKLKMLEIVSEDYEKSVLLPDQLIERANANGYTKRDGSPLTSPSVSWSSGSSQFVQLMGYAPNSLAPQVQGSSQLSANEYQQLLNFFGQQRAQRRIQQTMGSAGPLWIGPGSRSAFGIEPVEAPPEKELEIPIQQPTGKRRIKLRD